MRPAADANVSLSAVVGGRATRVLAHPRVEEVLTTEASVSEAKRRIGRRDPDDVEILALSLHFAVPIWSNDNDFEDAGVEWRTTAELLAKLGC